MICPDCWFESWNVGECIDSRVTIPSYCLEEDILQLQQQLYRLETELRSKPAIEPNQTLVRVGERVNENEQ